MKSARGSSAAASGLIALGCLVMLAACEAQDQCGAGCAPSVSVSLHRASWPDGAYALRAAYDDAAGQAHVVTCELTLPVDVQPSCSPSAIVSVGATVTLRIWGEPKLMTVSVTDPDGAEHELRIEPEYRYSWVCGSRCGTAATLVTLDADAGP